MAVITNAQCNVLNSCVSSGCDSVVVISAGAYQPPCGYSTTEPAPPQYVLPGFNYSCILSPPVPRPSSVWIKYDDIVVNRVTEQNFATCKTFVIENNVHHQHNKTVITTVNRNHLHTQRIITKENNYHHFNTDYIVKVNDIHTQRVENLATDGVVINDFKQKTVVEPATCQVTAECPLAVVEQAPLFAASPAVVQEAIVADPIEQQMLVLPTTPAPSPIEGVSLAGTTVQVIGSGDISASNNW